MRNLNQGFTLIEGISVMLILGVIAVTAAPRFSGSEAYSVTSARDVALSVARQVQLRAMQKEQQIPFSECDALVITASRFGGSDNAECKRQQDSYRTDVINLIDFGVTISTLETGVSPSALPYHIYFDLLGRPVAADGKTRLCQDSIACKITFEKAGTSESLCLNGEGYFYVC